jgi:integrase
MQHRIYERAGTYYLDVRVDGKRHRRSLDTGDRKEAEARAKIALDTLALATPRVGYLRLEDALTAVAKSKTNAGTREMYTYKARSICKVLPADGNILCLTREDVDRFIRARLAVVSRHTVHKELSLLRLAWSDVCPGQPSPVPSFSASYKPRKRFLTVDEAAKLLARAGRSRARAWLWLALWAGTEVGAIRRMTWAHIDLDLGMVHIPGTKAEARDRYVPLHAELRARLGGLPRDRPLVSFWRNRHRDLQVWCEDVEIERCTMTDLRRTFGSWLKQSGVDSRRVADLMGHTSTIMVDRVYGQLDAASYRDAIDRLPAMPRMVAL